MSFNNISGSIATELGQLQNNATLNLSYNNLSGIIPLGRNFSRFPLERSSRFGWLQGIQFAIAGKNLYMRFTCSAIDAMGMNMVSKGVQNVLDVLQSDFPNMDVIGISGNYC